MCGVVFIFLSFTCFAADVSLKLTSMDGISLKEAGTGQPFLLDVIINNASNTAQYPVLKGIENLHVRQSGFQMNMVNGTTSVTYHYRVRIDTPGSYTFGPAQITEPNGIVESAPITVIVGQDQKTSAPAKRTQQNNNAKSTFLRLSCDKTTAFVGEKVRCTLTFYTAEPSVGLQSIINPDQKETAAFVIRTQEGTTNGTEKINSVEHRFAQWNFDIYPTQSGQLVIPAYAADYTIQTNQAMFSFFFRNDTKRVYSNTLNLTIDPLPSGTPNPFVGIITDFNSKIEPAHAHVGEGMVLTITLKGDGDFDRLVMPSLRMPEGLKWYESKQYRQPSADNKETTHCMEYIVQGLQPGSYTIAPLELTYFDIKEKRYKTIKTATLSISIAQAAHKSLPEKTGTIQNLKNNPNTAHLQPSPSQGYGGQAEELRVPGEALAKTGLEGEPDLIRPLHQDGPWNAEKVRTIPWHIYWIIIGCMLLTWLLFIFFSARTKFNHFFAQFFHKKNIYQDARAAIKHAYRTNNTQSCYSIISNLLSARTGIPSGTLSPEDIERMLVHDGLSLKALEDWRIFYAELAESSFYTHAQRNQTKEVAKNLAEKSLYWVDVLEKLPRSIV